MEDGTFALPFLPGNSFTNPTKDKFHKNQSLTFLNGYSRPLKPSAGIGGEPMVANQLKDEDLDELANVHPTLTYGNVTKPVPVEFVPAHVAFDKKVLKFNAYFKQTVHESPQEYYRIRKIDIFYYLEDDSIAVVEEPVENSGIPQGKLIKRHRLPKNDLGECWHWKDLNLGIDMPIYGKVFHVYNCDQWTAEYLQSEGIELNSPEVPPTDPYTKSRNNVQHVFKTPSDYDKLKQFLKLDRKVLRFYCVWDDRDNMFGEVRPYVLHYYLVDNTVEVREVHEPNDGRDPFPVLLCRQKLPADRTALPSNFPSAILEISEDEISEWVSPSHLGLGKSININGRKFFIYDCDEFTRYYYQTNLKILLEQPIPFSRPAPKPVEMLMRSCECDYGYKGVVDIDAFHTIDMFGLRVIVATRQIVPDYVGSLLKQVSTSFYYPIYVLPPYNGFGSLEDSKQSCLSLIPHPPKKDLIKMLENDGKILRYAAIMDSTNPIDHNRRFIISFWLSDDTISIYEPPQRNSGIRGGQFLERTRISKPGSTTDNPEYYKPQDLAIGSDVECFKHKFTITDADKYVLKYMRDRRTEFPAETIDALAKKHDM